MKPSGMVSFILGIVLVALGVLLLVSVHGLFGLIPLFIGGALIFMGWRNDRVSLIVFGHVCIVLGCFLITCGIYLLPYSQPTLSHVFFRPLFWGLFSLMGGLCANYHGFCRCIRGVQ